jgi:hypothetical protein
VRAHVERRVPARPGQLHHLQRHRRRRPGGAEPAHPEFIGGFFTDWGTVFGATISGDQTTDPNANNCSLKVITSGSASSGLICSAS